MISPLEQTNNLVSANQKPPTPTLEDLRQAAQQFEAILLNQLTSTLNGTSEPDEDALFGSDGGSGLAKQMFSEQLATTMSKSGGVGLADMIMQKFGANQSKPTDGKIKGLTKPISAFKDIRENTAPKSLSKKVFPIIEKSINDPAYKPINLAGITSKIESPIDNTVNNLTLDGKVLNAMRPRIVPESAINKSETSPPVSEIYSVNIPTVSAPNDSMPNDSTAVVSYQIPVNGRLSSNFGNRFHPIDKVIKFHAGVDIAVPRGTRVNAAAQGSVVFAGKKGGYGNVVIIQHPDGRESRYGHLEKLLVSVGDEVLQGQEVAKSGSTGKSTGPHLHFEIRENGEVVNPLKILSNVLSKNADR